MNKSKMGCVPIPQMSREPEEVFLAKVRQKLAAVGELATPTVFSNKTILDGLAAQLTALHIKGFSFQEISNLLAQCGFDLSANLISEYFHRLRTRQLATCETEIARYHELACSKKSEHAQRIERGLRVSLKENSGMVLLYQPQVNMLTHEVVGAEALLRWEHDGQRVPPQDFIAIAEESHLIGRIGEWVLKEACAEAKRWQLLGLGGQANGIKMAVNVSVKQLTDELPATVSRILWQSGLPSSLLGLEITESSFAGKDSFATLQALRDHGFTLSIDDFGTGYSCLAGLKDLPVDTIKIDYSFVKGLTQNDGSIAVVETIIQLATKMGMGTLAEGVETEEQATVLKSMGCSVAQGFLYSQPVSGDEFIKFAQRQSPVESAAKRLTA